MSETPIKKFPNHLDYLFKEALDIPVVSGAPLHKENTLLDIFNRFYEKSRLVGPKREEQEGLKRKSLRMQVSGLKDHVRALTEERDKALAQRAQTDNLLEAAQIANSKLSEKTHKLNNEAQAKLMRAELKKEEAENALRTVLKMLKGL